MHIHIPISDDGYIYHPLLGGMTEPLNQEGRALIFLDGYLRAIPRTSKYHLLGMAEAFEGRGVP